MATIREKLAQQLQQARDYQSKLVRDLAETSARVTKLEQLQLGLTKEKEEFAQALCDENVIDDNEIPW